MDATGLPPAAAFTDHGDGTATFTWDTIAGDIGNHPVTFTATDASDPTLVDSELVTLGVIDDTTPILFPDSFNDGTGWSSRWTVYNDTVDPANWAVVNGELIQQNLVFDFQASYHTGTYAVLVDPAITGNSDYRFSVDITPLPNLAGDNQGNDVGIMFALCRSEQLLSRLDECQVRIYPFRKTRGR